MYEDTIFKYKQYITVLPEQQLNEYIKKYKEGQYKYKNIIITSTIPLVKYVIKHKYTQTMYEKSDLFQVGSIGLIKALETYDIERNIKFSTYAQTCILNEIRMYIRTNNKHLKVESINANVKNKQGVYIDFTYEDLIYDSQDIENQYEEKTVIIEALNIINVLSEKDKNIVCMYLGLGMDRRYTQAEIAKKLNLTQPTIHRKLKKTFIKIKNTIDEIDISQKKETRGRPRKCLIK